MGMVVDVNGISCVDMCGPVGDPGGHKPIKTVMGMVYGIELGLPHEWEWMIPWEYDVIICDIYIYIWCIYTVINEIRGMMMDDVMDDIWAAVGQPYDDIMGENPSIYDNI